MQETLTTLIAVAGAGQLSVLCASALVPFRLNWKTELAGLSRLHRQMHWIYGGYVVLAIVAFGLISLLNAGELASGGGLCVAFSRTLPCSGASAWPFRRSSTSRSI